MEFTIDGKKVQAREGSTILEAARAHDIPIPTLCYYEEVSPGGRCRLCTVEIVRPGKKRPLVLACAHPVEGGLEVSTRSEEVVASRKAAVRGLLERAPEAEKIRRMAREMGVEVTPPRSKGTGCILCGLCIRACGEIVGRRAIAFRRPGRVVKGEESPIEVKHDRCIGCGTCAFLCPTGFIKVEDYRDMRVIWDRVFRRKGDPISGKFYPPEDLTSKRRRQ